jgi:hypothetical protein
MSDERKRLTPEQAIECLVGNELIHTLRNTENIVMACDIDRKTIIEKINKHTPEIGGELSRKMDHGLVLKDEHGFLWIEADNKKLDELDIKL